MIRIDFKIIYQLNESVYQKGYVNIQENNECDDTIEWFYYDRNGFDHPYSITQHSGIIISQDGPTEMQMWEMDRFEQLIHEHSDYIEDTICLSKEDDHESYYHGGLIIEINNGNRRGTMVRVHNYHTGQDTYVPKYEIYCDQYGQERVDQWLNNVTMEQLMDCMDAFSSASFVDLGLEHREKDLNILEMILQETPHNLYRGVTYGTCPGTTCTDAIGELTGRKNGNIEIAIFLIQEKIHELKKWVLENYKFSDREKRLLHYDFKS